MTSRHPYLTVGRTDVLAHRGASADRPPGNTMPAFVRALELGVDHIETDVQASADGRVVVFHDDRLDGTTTGSGRIADHPWSHLQSLRYRVDGAPTDDGLILLEDALARFADAAFNIDVKTDATVEPVVDVLRRHDARARVCVAAFGWRRLRRLRRLLGDGWCTAYSRPEIAATRALSWLRLPVIRFGDAVQVPRAQHDVTVVDRRFVDACHRRHVAVYVWTVNDPAEVARLHRIGVDAVITDDPTTVLPVLDGIG